MKVLVTGSCGEVFSNFIIYALQETKWDLVSIDKLTHTGRLENIAHNSTVHNKRHKLYIGDVCDQHFVQKVFEIECPDIVVHGATCSGINNSTDYSELFRTNVMGTHSMLEATRTFASNLKLFINFSTYKTLGNINNGSFVETDPVNPSNLYSASKGGAELVGKSYKATYDVPVITTRCCNVFGSRHNMGKLIPKVIINSLNKEPILISGKGEYIREWIYVKDVFYAIKHIIECGSAGETYHIGSGYEINNIDLARKVINEIGADQNHIHFADNTIENDFRYSINSDKLKSLGWRTKYDFDSALSHTIGWYKANFNWACSRNI